MSNLQQRVISAIILAAIVLSLTWFGGLPFRLLAVAIGALVFYEWTTVSGVAKDRPLWMAAWTLVALVLAALIWSGFGHWILAGAVAASAAVILFGALRGQGGEAGGGMFYALLAAIALAQLRGDATSGLWVMIYLFAVVWATDIFAYFVGRAIGGPKLAPSISPAARLAALFLRCLRRSRSRSPMAARLRCFWPCWRSRCRSFRRPAICSNRVSSAATA